MLRRFIQCRSNEERLSLVKASDVKDWTTSQLETALAIVGFNNDTKLSNEEKKEKLVALIANKINGAAQEEQIFTDNMEDDRMVVDETVYGTKTEEERFRQAVAYAFVSQASMRI